jgi:hypothetical protein
MTRQSDNVALRGRVRLLGHGSMVRQSGARGRRRRGRGRGGSGGVVEMADTEALPWWLWVTVGLHGEASCGGVAAAQRH